MQPTGEVVDVENEMEFNWKIRNFFSLSVSKSYCSSAFRFAGNYWFISMCPNVEERNNPTGYLDLHLTRLSSGPPICVRYSLGMRGPGFKKDREIAYTYVFGMRTTGIGASKYISRSELEGQKSYLVPFGNLTVFCTLKYPATGGNEMEKILSEDLKRLMLSAEHSDVVFMVKGKEFSLHKNILGARSLFFNAMFRNKMKENITNIVSIDDCEPEIFSSFIHFLYTGTVDELSMENVCDLYKTANKYQENELKNECVKFMLNNIRVDNFCDLVTLALIYNERELYESAINFFTFNTKEIICHEKWLSFLGAYPERANEMHIKALDRSHSLSKCF